MAQSKTAEHEPVVWRGRALRVAYASARTLTLRPDPHHLRKGDAQCSVDVTFKGGKPESYAATITIAFATAKGWGKTAEQALEAAREAAKELTAQLSYVSNEGS